jgi:hypothetical protein
VGGHAGAGTARLDLIRVLAEIAFAAAGFNLALHDATTALDRR